MAKAGATFRYNDIKGISAFLENVSRNIFQPDTNYIKEFSRINLIRRILPLLNR